MSRRARGVPWALMAALIVVCLVIASRGQSRPPTDAQRVSRITSEIRCPTCRGLSVAESDAPPAKAIREEVLRRVQVGETDSQIFDYVISRYGNDVRLRPESKGVGVVVWALPVMAVVAAIGGLAVTFRRWRPGSERTASDNDKALVDKALQP